MVRKTILVAVALFAAVPAVAQQGEWQGPFTVTAKWGPFLDVEGMVGNKRSIGELDLFVPLGQSERTLLFADARFKADNQESLEGNFGLGLRHMLAGGWNAGAYGYFDRRRTPTFNSYNQLTFGGEMLGTNFDLRGNTYWPIGQTSNVVSSSAGGPATAAVSGTSLLVTFPGMSTSTEYAMAGFDAEAGVRVPIFDTTGPYDLRFYAGGYRFSDGITPVVAGPRLRLEFTNYRIPELWGGTRLMTGVEYQYDDVRGSQVFASLRLRVPLQAEPRRGTLTYQERRMTDPIVRDIDIVAQVQTVTAPSDRGGDRDGGWQHAGRRQCGIDQRRQPAGGGDRRWGELHHRALRHLQHHDHHHAAGWPDGGRFGAHCRAYRLGSQRHRDAVGRRHHCQHGRRLHQSGRRDGQQQHARRHDDQSHGRWRLGQSRRRPRRRRERCHHLGKHDHDHLDRRRYGIWRANS